MSVKQLYYEEGIKDQKDSSFSASESDSERHEVAQDEKKQKQKNKTQDTSHPRFVTTIPSTGLVTGTVGLLGRWRSLVVGAHGRTRGHFGGETNGRSLANVHVGRQIPKHGVGIGGRRGLDATNLHVDVGGSGGNGGRGRVEVLQQGAHDGLPLLVDGVGSVQDRPCQQGTVCEEVAEGGEVCGDWD